MDLTHLNINEIEQLRGLLSLASQMGTANITLGTFVEEYLRFIKLNRSEAYLKSNRISLTHLVGHFKEQRMMSMISFRDAEIFITQLQQKVSKGYRVYYRNLKAAFNKAVEWGYISANPFLKVKLPKQQKNQPAYLSEEELKVILGKIEVVVVKEISALSFYTGCRLGELVELKWKNVNISDRYVVIGDDEFQTKGRNQRTIPLCDEAVRILQARLGKVIKLDGYVFNKTNDVFFSGDYISKKFKRGCRLAEVSEKIHFHSLRHSFASNLAQQGVSLYVIKELLGHSSITTTEIYAHLNLDGLREAISKLNVETKDVKIKPPLNLPLKKGETFKKSSDLKLIVEQNKC